MQTIAYCMSRGHDAPRTHLPLCNNSSNSLQTEYSLHTVLQMIQKAGNISRYKVSRGLTVGQLIKLTQVQQLQWLHCSTIPLAPIISLVHRYTVYYARLHYVLKCMHWNVHVLILRSTPDSMTWSDDMIWSDQSDHTMPNHHWLIGSSSRHPLFRDYIDW